MGGALDTNILIVGGGPAGLAASVWASDLGIPCLVVEGADTVGGQLSSVFGPIENYPGTRFSNGAEMQRELAAEVARRGVEVRAGASVVSLDVGAQTARLSTGAEVAWEHLVIATGIRRRQLGVPGEAAFHEKGILTSGVGQLGSVTGKRIAIIGGGDAAFENALILSAAAASVIVLNRSGRISARDEFVGPVRGKQNVEIVESAVVRSFHGSASLESVEVEGPDGETRNFPIELALIRIGVEPNSEIVRGLVELDEKGYVLVDQYGRTSLPNIFAVGDVAFPESPTLSTALGSAVSAVKFISKSLHKKRPLNSKN